MNKYLIIFILVFTLVFQAKAEDIFKDVGRSNINKEAIEFIKWSWIADWYEDLTFRPDNKINRAEFLKIALKSNKDFDEKKMQECLDAKNNVNHDYVYLSDVTLDKWYAPYVCLAYETKVIKWYPDGTFKAENEINFTEMAKIIVNTQWIELWTSSVWEEWYKAYVDALSRKKAIPISIKTVDHKVTRWEMTESIYRILKKIENKSSMSLGDLISWNTSNSIIAQIKNSKESWKMWEVASCSILWDIMKNSVDYSNDIMMRRDMLIDVDMSSNDVQMDESSSEMKTLTSGVWNDWSDDFSQTNIQVRWVDEADIVKNDWKYIYMIKRNNIRIIDAYPSEKIKEISKIDFSWKDFNPEQLFLSDDKLIIIWSTWRQSYPKPSNDVLRADMIMPRYWRAKLTKVYVVDIKDRQKPAIEREVSYEWNYSQSRKIWEFVYLILNKNPDYHILRELKADEQNIIPFVEDSSDQTKKARPIVWCDDIEFFPWYERPNYLIISAIPTKNKDDKITSKVFLWASENVYMSLKSLYVATWVNDIKTWFWNYNNTQIYKFDIDQTNIDFNSSSEVPWRILNQFSMDEYRWYFRIATTLSQNNVSNNLYVLDSKLFRLWKVENIAPWERIKSVRFMWERVFMVTFKNIDPFFVIDLSNVHLPKILWELKIPGWSDYLHPYDKNHLIWFWREVDEKAVKRNWRFTFSDTLWMKISIFDVSNLSNPKEIYKKVIWTRWTQSEILQDHKALLFDKDKNLLAIPILIKEKKESDAINCYDYRFSSCPVSCSKRCTPSSCSSEWMCTDDCDWPWSCVYKNSNDSIKTVFAWAIVFDISIINWIKEKGRISNYDIWEYEKQYFYENYEKKIRRIIYIWNKLFTISPDIIKVSDIGIVKEIKALKLD